MKQNQPSNNSRYAIMLMIISAISACLGQLFWKLYALQQNMLLLFFGFSLYLVGAILMLVAYRHGNLSTLQPMLGLSYAISMGIGYFFLGETVTFVNVVGCTCIIGGVIFISTSK